MHNTINLISLKSVLLRRSIKKGLGLLIYAILVSTTLGVMFLQANVIQAAMPGTWSTTGSMNIGRYGHTATRLLNGKVLVAGGSTINGITNSCEIYDPGTDNWSITGNMDAARYLFVATLLPDGEVLAMGGYNTNSGIAVNSCELYDPKTGSWSTTGSMRLARLNFTATLLDNGKVLIAGGNTGSPGWFEINSCELYDPDTGTWTATGSLNTTISSQTATLLPNGDVLIAGGQVDSSITKICELYNPETGSWSYTGSMDAAREGHTATLLPNGRVLVAAYGQIPDGNPPENPCELYDRQTGTWSLTGSLISNAHLRSTATLLSNGEVLVTGGSDGGGEENAINLCELYSPALGSTQTSLKSSINPSTCGQSVTFTARVNPQSSSASTPTGTVTFKDSTTTLGTKTLNGSGVATYTIKTLNAGNHSITTVYNGDTNYVSSTSATLIQTVNQASNDAYSIDEDTTLTVSAPGVLANDGYVDGEILKATLVTGVSHGILSLNSNGSYSYTPAANYYGTDTFTYRAYDGILYSNTAKVTFTVNNINDPPDAVNDTATVLQNSLATAINVLANDTYLPDPPETLTITVVTQGAHGVVTITGRGSGLTYQPNTGYSGSDSFKYTISDGNSRTDTATVNIYVNPPDNHPPVADNQDVVTDENVAASFTINATDADGDRLTYSVTASPVHGALTGIAPNFKYTPAADYYGKDSFSFIALDGTAESNLATVTITVNPSPLTINQIVADLVTKGVTKCFLVEPDNSSGHTQRSEFLTAVNNIGPSIEVTTFFAPAESTTFTSLVAKIMSMDSDVCVLGTYDIGRQTYIKNELIQGGYKGLIYRVTVPAPPSGSGGGGPSGGPVTGGGGGGSGMGKLYPGGFSSKTPLDINSQGIIPTEGKLTTQDGQATLNIAAKTKLLTKEGNALSIITVENASSLADAPNGNALVIAYTFSPEGSTFNPSLDLRITYDTAKLPAGMTENDLYIAYFDGNQWQALESNSDTQSKYITAKITHFSSYALMGQIRLPTPTSTPSSIPEASLAQTPSPATGLVTILSVTPMPTEQPSPIQSETPTPSPQASPQFNLTILIALIVAAIVVILVVMMVTLRRRV